MRNLIISDIHANLIALETVLTDVGQFDAVWCLGDLVGYGADPVAVIERVAELKASGAIVLTMAAAEVSIGLALVLLAR